LALLRLTHAAADVFPPLKGATGGALHIVDMVTGRFDSKVKSPRIDCDSAIQLQQSRSGFSGMRHSNIFLT